MPDIYCELPDGQAAEFGGSKYVTFYANERRHPYNGRFHIVQAADRIWVQDDADIIFVKNRYSDPEATLVDPTEFMWVKLKSVPV